MKSIDYAAMEGALFTDLYQLTMAQLYFRTGIHERPAQFDHFFRSYPDYGEHKAGYCVNAGLEWLVDWMRSVRFRDRDVDYLRRQKGRNDTRIFGDDFLDWLKNNGNFDALSMQSVAEGRIIHPNTTVTLVKGPLAMAQILESPLLNFLNYPILIATKAARIHEAGLRRPLIEFGMRRGHGKGVNAGVRAAFIGGADYSSNTGVSCALGYPPKGTHAHSMVQAFMALAGSERDAFEAYADVYPDDCLLLVDTVDTLESGLPNAIKVFEKLKRKGHRPAGIRLDSGDLAWLSIRAAKMLNEAGFDDARIVLSNQIDEMVLWQIISQIREDASDHGVDPASLIDRLVYGVGTSLIASKGESALDGVYKLAAIHDKNEWVPAIKISENREKIINPGHKRLLRIYDHENKAVADMMCMHDESFYPKTEIRLRHPVDASKQRNLPQDCVREIEPLLEDVMADGELVYDFPSIAHMREKRRNDLDRLHRGVKRLMNPHVYHVSLSEKLWNLKEELIRRSS